MPNLSNTTTFNPDQYAALSGALSTSLQKSPTAYTPNTTPTTTDLSQQIQLMNLRQQAETAQNEKRSQEVYGNETAPQYDLNNPVPQKQSPIVWGLNALATPLYAVTGAIQALTGTGDKKGLENVFNAVRTQQTSGDTLRKMGVTSPWATIPLGFALDVALDPVMWATAGTDALIPKLATGAFKAGPEGLVAAAKAGGLEKLSSLAKFAAPVVEDKAITGIASKAAEAEDLFRNLVGKPSVIEEAATQKAGLLGAKKLAAKIASDADPEGNLYQKSMAWLQKNFEYSPTKRIMGQMADEVAMAKEKESGVQDSLDRLIQEAGGKLDLGQEDDLSKQLSFLAKSQAEKDSLLEVNNAAFNPPARGVLATQGSADVAKEMKSTTDLISKTGETFKGQLKSNISDTGVKWYDNFVKWVNSSPAGQKAWNTLAYASNLFKISKVPLNYFTAHANAVVSNLIMSGMYGISISDARYLNILRETRNLINGRAISDELAHSISPEIFAIFKKYGETLSGSIGLNQKMLENSIARGIINKSGKIVAGDWASFQDVKNILSKTEYVGEFKPDEVLNELNDLKQTAQVSREEAKVAGQKVVKNVGQLEKFQAEKVEPAIMSGEAARPALPEMTSFISEDLMSNGPLMAKLEQWDESGNKIQKFISGVLLKSQQRYNSIDQTFKIAAFLHLSINGVSGPELLKIAKSLPLEAKDISLVNGFYRIAPEKAMIAANEIAMDYAAMPSAVKVLRNMPILGSPFMSFSYASMAKAGKTLINNPEYLNKITFARQEIGRGLPQSPLEKAALEGPYFNYLNRYERMKLPFFQDFPQYLNIANWVPYLSLNFFQPSERDYADNAGGTMLKIIDQMPFLKTPEGQILVDTVIQPFILNEANPTGMFGQNVFPVGGTPLQKLENVGQDIVGNYVPNLTPLVGFRANQLMNAIHGKNSQGVQSSQPAGQLVAEWLAAMLGVSVAPVNLQNLGSGLKKQLNLKPPTAKK